VPPGEYTLTITSFEQKTAKSSQQSMISVVFDVADGDCAGQKVYNNYSLSPKALGRIKALMVAAKTELTRIVASQFLGQTIKGTVVHTEGQGSVDTNGNPLPARTFANVINEQPLDEAPAQKVAAKTPPVMNKPATKPAVTNNTGARRA
jgi:hypothetical protein